MKGCKCDQGVCVASKMLPGIGIHRMVVWEKCRRAEGTAPADKTRAYAGRYPD